MKSALAFILILFLQTTYAAPVNTCDHWYSWSKPACDRLRQIWTEGSNELYLTGFAWHNRYQYEKERVHSYNENAWGGGLGKGLYDEHGNWHGLYAFAFQDSHKNVEPIAGYAFLKTAHLNNNTSLGAGISAFLTSRADIFNNIPFPGILPWLALTYQKATLAATYIPGAKDAGNVLFIFAKWQF